MNQAMLLGGRRIRLLHGEICPPPFDNCGEVMCSESRRNMPPRKPSVNVPRLQAS